MKLYTAVKLLISELSISLDIRVYFVLLSAKLNFEVNRGNIIIILHKILIKTY